MTLGVVIGKFLPPHRGHSYLIDTATARRRPRRRLRVLPRRRPRSRRRSGPRCCASCIPGVDRAWSPPTTSPMTAGDGRRGPGRSARSHCSAGGVPTSCSARRSYGAALCRVHGRPARRGRPRAAALPGLGHRGPRRSLGLRGVPVAGGARLVRAAGLRAGCRVHRHHHPRAGPGRALRLRHGCPSTAASTARDAWPRPARSTGAPTTSLHIARQQLADEDAAARRGGPLLICDTDALATSVWHERYLGTGSVERGRLAAGAAYALYVLTGDDIPFVQDGTRDGEHVRGWMTARFRERLSHRREPWSEVRGRREERLAAAVARIDRLPTPSTPAVERSTCATVRGERPDEGGDRGR